ncbi:hypothetical protein CHS0354_004500 [Potamilus streckersoni]|uniref:L-Fucosyltransferase n=1 Tax=Potamilus streckersoni TaxID=2493646 RepID=A0AAE0SNV3_9BIVA|nr:hypothetical protein CHS0354_004500 [Potamilus streckersoni]
MDEYIEKPDNRSKVHRNGLDSIRVSVKCFVCLSFAAAVIVLIGLNTYSDGQYTTINMGPGHFLCYTGEGRLGNQMFRFASLTGIATQNNFTLIISKNDPLYRIFDLKNVLVLETPEVCDKFKLVQEASCCCKFDKNLIALPNNQSYTVGYYLQSWKYFSHVQKEICEQFHFKNSTRKKASLIVKNARSSFVLKSATLIGVHIRRGDLVKEKMYNNAGIVPAPKEYVYKAMDYMKDKFQKSIFLVVSDDMNWSQETLCKRTKDNIYFVDDGNAPELDLAILASCDHVIFTVGTFGWWAGFLARGITVYYTHPARNGSQGELRYNYDDLFLPHWIGLSV